MIQQAPRRARRHRRVAATGRATAVVVAILAYPLAASSGALVTEDITEAVAEVPIVGDTVVEPLVDTEPSPEDTDEPDGTAEEGEDVTGGDGGDDPVGDDPGPSPSPSPSPSPTSAPSPGATAPPATTGGQVQAPSSRAGVAATPGPSTPPSGGAGSAAGEPSLPADAATPAVEATRGAVAPRHRLLTEPDRGLAQDVQPSKAGASVRSSAPVFDVLRGLDLAPVAAARVVAPFPVAGPATYTADFGSRRYGPGDLVHAHEGTDIFASRGTAVIASGAGRVSGLRLDAVRDGTSLRLTARDGTVFVYAHLDRFAPGLTEGAEVRKGDILGFVGTTGTPDATAPHLHFEIRPRGGAAVDPVPHLDRWLADAAATVDLLSKAPAGTLSFARTAGGVRGTGNGEVVGGSAVAGPGPGAGSGAAPGWAAGAASWALQPIAAVSDRIRSDWLAVVAGLPLLLAFAWRARRRTAA